MTRVFHAFSVTSPLLRPAGPPAWMPWPEVPSMIWHDHLDAFVYAVHVPRFRRRDIDVQVHDRKVTVSGQRREGLFRPRVTDSFVHSFALPDGADDGDVRAQLRSGTLYLTVAKKPSARLRRIPIRATAGAEMPATSGDASDVAPDRRTWWRRLSAKLRLP